MEVRRSQIRSHLWNTRSRCLAFQHELSHMTWALIFGIWALILEYLGTLEEIAARIYANANLDALMILLGVPFC